MQSPTEVQSIKDICSGSKIGLPHEAGLYAFWWIGDRDTLLNSNRSIILKGPGGRLVNVSYGDWWPEELAYPCLYVGKTTNIRKRFSLHLKRGCGGRLHDYHPENHKTPPKTTSCQVRWGIEHIFPEVDEPLAIIENSVGFSYRTDFGENNVAERFFQEDLLIGTWRPWFNIDSER